MSEPTLEDRIAALESQGPCDEQGHHFEQARDEFRHLLFCGRCGAVVTLGRVRKVGFEQGQVDD